MCKQTNTLHEPPSQTNRSQGELSNEFITVTLIQSPNIARNYYHFVFISTKVGHECQSQLQSNFGKNDSVHSLWIFALSWLIRTLFIHTSPHINKNDLDLNKSKSHWCRTLAGGVTWKITLFLHVSTSSSCINISPSCKSSADHTWPCGCCLCRWGMTNMKMLLRIAQISDKYQVRERCVLCVVPEPVEQQPAGWPQICVKESFSATL